MDLMNLDTKELKAELERRNTELRNKEIQRRQEQDLLLIDNIDILLKFVPKHSCNSCSDSNYTNAGRARCRRCFLLQTKSDNYVDPDYEIYLNVETRDDVSKMSFV